jgi:hypothetical protein
MIKVKQQTIAGPRSPSNKKRKIVARMAIRANAKKLPAFCPGVVR